MTSTGKPIGINRANLAHEILRARVRDTPVAAKTRTTDRISEMQERIWLEQQMEPGSATFNAVVAIELRGIVDADRLAAAIRSVVLGDPELDSILVATERGVRRRPCSSAVPPIQIQATGQAPPLDAAIGDICRAFAAEPFDLAQSRPIRARILSFRPDALVLILVAHHVAWDGGSTAAFFRRLVRVYGGEEAAAAAPAAFARYADRERRLVATADSGALRARAEQGLAGPPASDPFPTDYPRRAGFGASGWRATARIPAGLLAQIDRLAVQLASSRIHVLLAGLAALASRNGVPDLLAGLVISTRDRHADGDAIGMFLRLVPVRIHAGQDTNFGELVGLVRDALADALDFARLPYATLLAILRGPADAAPADAPGNPVRLLFSLDREPASPLDIPGVAARFIPVSTNTARADAGLSFIEDAGELILNLELRRELYAERTASLLAARFERTMKRLVAEPDLAINAAAVVPLAEARHITRALTGPRLPEVRDVFALIRESVLNHPEAPAVAGDGAVVSYRELASMAGVIADVLRAQGARPGDKIGLLAQRDWRTVASLLGIWQVGGVVVPLDPALPYARLRSIFDIITPALLVCIDRAAAPAPPAGRSWLEIGLFARDAGIGASLFSQPRYGPAIVEFTSGSTGTPKGVVLTHEGVAATLAAAHHFDGIEDGARVTWSASLAFDIAFLEILLPLTLGGTIIVHHSDPIDVELLARQAAAADVFHAVPTVMRDVLAAVGDATPNATTRPRLLLVGGEKVTPDLLDKIRARWPSAAVRVLYGPTEASIICCSAAVNFGVAAQRPIIGGPHPLVRLRIVDPNGRLQPTGVPGELLIGGTVLAAGYLEPRETAARFIRLGAHRYFRTGDVVRLRPDNAIEFVGRIDSQEKIGGTRVEPEEVEAAIRAFPAVDDVAVIGIDDDAGIRRLAAFITVRSGRAELDYGAMRRTLLERLPRMAVPTTFVSLPVMPCNRNGKVDRGALAAMPSTFDQKDPSAGRETEIARILATLGAQVLRKAVKDPAMNFFALGGDSLAAARLRVCMHAMFGRAPSIGELLRAGTFIEMARMLARQVDTAQDPEPDGEAEADHVSGVSLTEAQHVQWTWLRHLPPSKLMTIRLLARLRSSLRQDELENALRIVVARHDALRIRIVEPADETGKARQVLAEPELDLAVVDAGPPAADRETVDPSIDAFFDRGFALTSQPPIRFLLAKTGDDWLFGVCAHHIVADGWSMAVLLQDIVRACDAQREPMYGAGTSPSFLDYAIADARRALKADAAVSSWVSTLTETDMPPATLFRPSPERGLTRPALLIQHLKYVIGEGLTAASLDIMCFRLCATPFAIGLSAFAVVLANRLCRRRVRIATMVANRDAPNTTELVGPLVNVLLIDVEVHPHRPFSEIVSSTMRALSGALVHQAVTIDMIRRDAKRLGRNTYNLRSAFLFEWGGQRRQTIEGRTTRLETLDDPRRADGAAEFRITSYEIAGVLFRDGDSLALDLTYLTDVFEREQAEDFASSFVAAMHSILACPEVLPPCPESANDC